VRPTLTEDLREAGKRIADQLNARLTFGDPFELRNCVMAFRLQDGTTDGTVYESIADAKRFTDDSRYCYFAFLNVLGGANAYECGLVLAFYREARDAGLGQKDNETPFLSTHGGDVMSGRMTPRPILPSASGPN
jgi:hypothetical protein